jgi:hypothetical protein
MILFLKNYTSSIVLFLIFFLLLGLLIIKFPKKYTEEQFVVNKTKYKNIWMYWENKPGKTKPVYLKLCFDTIFKNCDKNFTIHLLDEKTIYNYLPNLRKDLDEKLNIPQKADYYRLKLLEKYGGIWLDSDTIVLKDLTPIVDRLEKYDFVGMGCIGRHNCKCGFPNPSNWVMASRPNTSFMKSCIEMANYLLDNNDRTYFQIKYHSIGRKLLSSVIENYIEMGWKYYHYKSACLERDSNGDKFTNNRLLDEGNIDQKCEEEYLLLPIYNTAPGFPPSFLEMSKKEILNSNMLISKFFRKALDI